MMRKKKIYIALQFKKKKPKSDTYKHIDKKLITGS